MNLLIRITSLLIYALRVVSKISGVYYCVSLQLDAGSWPLQLSKFGLSDK